MSNRIGPSTYFSNQFLDTLPEREKGLVTRRNEVLGAGYRLFYDHPLEFVRGSGSRLFTGSGEEYLDAYNNVPVVGHSNAAVAAAMHRQSLLLNSHTRYLHEEIIDYAENLLANFPSQLNRAVFTCTGSESNDLALRMARHLTGSRGVIITSNAYHGVTSATAEISPSLQGADTLPDWVISVPSPVESVQQFKLAVTAAIDSLEQSGMGVAAIIVDTVFASDGAWVGDQDEADLMAEAFDEVRAAGGLFIADEVQAGFGRLGDRLFGFQQHGWLPELVTLGKPMANGQPVAALIANSAKFEEFGNRVRYFNTFAGTPVSMAAARATLDQIFELSILSRVSSLGVEFGSRLTELAQEFTEIGQIRGKGLYWAIDLTDGNGNPSEPLARTLVNELRHNRILVSASGPHNNALKIRPPLVFDDSDAEMFFEKLRPSLASALSKLKG